MSETEKILNALEAEVSTSDRYELDAYELGESYEVESYLQKTYRKNPLAARKIAMKAVRNPRVMNVLKDEMRRNGGQGLVSIQQDGSAPMVAQFVLKATRNSKNIAADLPFAFFGSLDIASNYSRFLAGLLPAGATLDVDYGTIAGQPNAARFTYVLGANTDTIDVTCAQCPYPIFLESLKSDTIKLSRMRMSISDTTQVAQFDESLDFNTASLFGKKGSNPVTPANYKSPEQFQAGIVDIDGVFDIDKETAIVSKILQAPAAGFSVSLNFSASGFSRLISK